MRGECKAALLALLLGLLAFGVEVVGDLTLQGRSVTALLTSPARLLPHLAVLALFILFGLLVARTLNRRRRAQDILRDDRDRYGQMFTEAADGAWALNLEGRIERANRSLCELTNLKAEAMVDRHCHEILRSPLCHTPRCPLRRLAAGESFAEQEVLVSRGDDRQALCLIAAHPLRDHDGTVLGIVEAYRNLTEQRTMEARFQALVETTGDGITIIDPEGRITYANRAFCDMLGYGLDQLLGRDALELCAPENEHMLRSQMRQRQTGAQGAYELEFQSRNGDPVPVLVTATPLYGESGAFTGSFAVMKDISQQRRDAQRTEHLNSVLRAVRNVNQLITREQDRDHLLQQACECLIETRGYHFAAVMLTEATGECTGCYGAGLADDLQQICHEALAHGLEDLLARPPSPSPVSLGGEVRNLGERFGRRWNASHECLGMRLEYGESHYGAILVSLPADLAESLEERGLFEEVAGDLAFALHALEAERDRRQYQTTLAAERDRWQRMLNTARVLIVSLNAEGQITYFSPYCEAVSGFSAAEVGDRPFWEFLIPERERETVRRGFERLWQGEMIPQFENPWQAKDGHELLINWRSTAAVDAAGATAELICIGLDITEHRAAELAVRESEERYRALFNGGDDAIFVFALQDGRAGNFLEVNEVACRKFGYSRDELLKLSPEALDDPDDALQAPDVIELLHRQEHVLFEQAHLTRDGHTIPMEVNAHLIEFAGRPAVLSIARDITERKETAAHLAHLNSVLMAIRNVNQLITRVTDREELLQQACECLVETRGYHVAGVVTVDDNGAVDGTYAAAAGGRDHFLTPDVSGRLPALLSAREGDPAPLLLSAEQLNWSSELRAEAAAGRTVMAIDLASAGRRFGLLAISVLSEMAHDDDEQGLFAEVAGDLAFALHAIETAAERERALEELELTQFSVARTANAVFWTDAGGRILFANDAALDRLGYTLEQIRQVCVGDLDPNFPADAWPAHWEQLRSQGSLSFETLHRTRDGEQFPVDVSANYLNFRGKEYNFAFARDVSGRKAAEARLRRLNQQYELLVESELVATFIVQAEQLTFASQTMHDKLGYGRGELVGKPVLELISPEFRDAAVEWRAQQQAGQLRSSELETQMLTCQGNPRWVRIWLHEIEDFEGSPTLIGHLVDVTEERELRSQLEHSQRLESLGTLAGGVAHEFNNVLQAILLNASLLHVDRKLADGETEKLKTIIERTEYGARLTDQLLTFSRRAPVQTGPLDLREVVEETRRLLERTIPRHIRISCDTMPDLWPIQGDSGRLKQVLINLAINARDAISGDGLVTFEAQNVMLSRAALKTMQKLRPGPHVLLTVTDNGCGMDPQVASRAFEPFFTTKSVGQGTGLGLSIVHGIVDSHSGHIKLNTRPGQGTSFQIYLPACPEASAPTPGQSSPATPPGGGNETVLVVDDEPDVVRVAEEALGSYGYKVLCASGGAQALELVAANPGLVQVVLLDLVMPGMSGQETFARLRELAPDLRVIIASGCMPESDRREPGDGPQAYLDKPFTLDKLLKTVRAVLEA